MTNICLWRKKNSQLCCLYCLFGPKIYSNSNCPQSYWHSDTFNLPFLHCYFFCLVFVNLFAPFPQNNVLSCFQYLLATWGPVQQATLNWGGDFCQEFRVRPNSSVFLHIKRIFQSDTMFQLTLMLIVSDFILLIEKCCHPYNCEHLKHPDCIII